MKNLTTRKLEYSSSTLWLSTFPLPLLPISKSKPKRPSSTTTSSTFLEGFTVADTGSNLASSSICRSSVAVARSSQDLRKTLISCNSTDFYCNTYSFVVDLKDGYDAADDLPDGCLRLPPEIIQGRPQLAGLRRRCVTPTAINSFVRGIGITRSEDTLISVERLEYHAREELNREAPRTMVVLHPLKVVITNLEANSTIEVDAKKWPDAKSDDVSAFYKIPFSNIVYIERSDFRMQDSKDYYGLAPGKSVILRYAFPIKCTEVILAYDNETILEIRAEYDPSKKTNPKGVLHWVPQPSPGVDPFKIEVRLLEKLFLSENPAELDNWLGDLNPHSKVVIPDAYGMAALREANVGDRFQFERLDNRAGFPFHCS
ncbi:glutamine--tRNA ligase [Senna tora]|uniref:glutamine--tRNA ligase n=1 Tax=Senna tora TaxID=362788 RepID=A0A834WFF5_9FABA|nr:glutamine--tRNA ligase [Senna tora]